MKKISQQSNDSLVERVSPRRRPSSRRRGAASARLCGFAILAVLSIFKETPSFERSFAIAPRAAFAQTGGLLAPSAVGWDNSTDLLQNPYSSASFNGDAPNGFNASVNFNGSKNVVSDSDVANDSVFLTAATAPDDALPAASAADALGLSPETRALAEEFDRQYETKTVGGSTIFAPNSAVSAAPIGISADFGWKGVDDEIGEVYVLYGNCRVAQGSDVVSGPAAVVWKSAANGTSPARAVVYLEKDPAQPEKPLQLDLDSSVYVEAKSTGDAWLGTFQTSDVVDLRIATPGENQLKPEEIYFRAQGAAQNDANVLAFSPGSLPPAPEQDGVSPETDASKGINDVVQTARDQNADASSAPILGDENGQFGWNLSGDGNEFSENAQNADGSQIARIPETSQLTEQFKKLRSGDVPPFRRVQFFQRYDRNMDAKRRPNSSESADGDGKDVWLVSNGFTIVVQGLSDPSENALPIGEAIEISADQAAIWTTELDALNFADKTTANDLDFELYLDGNVVFREGDNVIYAKKMYYDVKNRVGIVQDAELIARIPDVQNGYVRLAAEKIAQRGPDALYASNAWISTSMMGEPTYRIQSDSIVAEKRRNGLYDVATGRPAIDPQTGKQRVQEEQYFIAENNVVAIGNVPVFYWPWLAMDIEDRSTYLRSLKFGSDSVFGTQARTTWNPYQLFGMSDARPAGTDWDLHLDYLSDRGLGHGTTFLYNRESIGCWDSRALGMANFYGISDKGTDNLGFGRRSVPFPHSYRYRAIWKHRQEIDNLGFLGDGWLLTGQLGKSSDRNFIPQYFEEEWNTTSNPETSFEIKKTVNNSSFSATTTFRTDSFYTQSNWLPRLDHYWLGQSLGPLVWYEHTKLGFAQFKTTDVPYAQEDRELFRYLDWELASDSTSNSPFSPGTQTLSAEGLVFSTRHEIDAPFQLGPIKATPYALGEYGYWGEGVSSNDVSRLYGRLGLRLNLPIWKIDSSVKSQTWYLNGLAHKMNFVVDASYSDANQNYDDLVLYDQIDDWQIQEFRRRYSVTTFAGSGGTVGFEDSIPVRFDERYYAIRQGDIGGNVTSASTELADDLQLVRLGWNNRWQTKRGPAGRRRVVDWITLNAGVNLYPKQSENFGEIPGLLDFDASWQVGDRFSVLSSGIYDVWGSGQKITRFGIQTQRPGLSSTYLGIDSLTGPIDSTYLNFAIKYRASEKWGIGFENSIDLTNGYDVGQALTISRVGESFVFTLGANRNQSKDNWGLSLSVEPVFLFDKGKRDEGLLGLGAFE